MPISDGTINSIISTAGLLGATAANAYAVDATNSDARGYGKEMYQRQRDDAIYDRDFALNYNHPAAQMERLKQAGLNPNLVYGNGATTQAQPTRAASAASWNPQAADYSMLSQVNPISQYQDFRTKKQTNDNLEAQLSVIKEQANLTSAQVLKTMADTRLTKSQDKQLNSLLSGQLQIQQAELENKRANTVSTLDQNQRNALTTAQGLKEGLERITLLQLQQESQKSSNAKTNQEISNLKEMLKSIKSDTELKQLDINLKKIGIQPGDNAIIRAAGQLIGSGQWGTIPGRNVAEKMYALIFPNLPTFIQSMLTKSPQAKPAPKSKPYVEYWNYEK